jgi:hypothetical protein
MADNNSNPVCGVCKFFLSSGDFGICRRFPSYEQRHASNWCGEHFPIIQEVKQPVEPVIEFIEAKKRGRPAKGKA